MYKGKCVNIKILYCFTDYKLKHNEKLRGVLHLFSVSMEILTTSVSKIFNWNFFVNMFRCLKGYFDRNKPSIMLISSLLAWWSSAWRREAQVRTPGVRWQFATWCERLQASLQLATSWYLLGLVSLMTFRIASVTKRSLFWATADPVL